MAKAVKVSELKMIPVSQLRLMGCAWKGCEAAFDAREGHPPGWSALLLTRSFRHVSNLLEIPPGECLRDTSLCPEHTRLFESQLKDLGRPLATTAGSA